jgi:hypothetical protein
MKSCVIIPTIRDFGIVKNYVENCHKNNFSEKLFFLLVTEDFCDISGMQKMLNDLNVEGEVFSLEKRNTWMEENKLGNFKDLIPKKSHAETSFGLLYMWANGFENGYFIDDDTLPTNDDFFGLHKKNLTFTGNINCVSSDKNWVNVLYERFSRHNLYPRGFPYSCMTEKNDIKKKSINDVVISQGLWSNVPDLDALRILMQGKLDGIASILTKKEDFTENFIVDKKNYLTICSMNLAFKREVIPAFYQLPMDDNKWKIGRFDDIWSGVIIKKVCDLLNKEIITGSPICAHNKAPRNTFKDLYAEMPALELNENLWKILDNINYKSTNFIDLYDEIAKALIVHKGVYYNTEFLNYMGKLMSMWTEAIRKLG